jgi:hypothetical protein
MQIGHSIVVEDIFEKLGKFNLVQSVGSLICLSFYFEKAFQFFSFLERLCEVKSKTINKFINIEPKI